MQPGWDDLRAVLMVVRYRTLARAAEALGVNYTTVARRIKRAEEAMSVSLFERLADGYRPTKAAMLVADQAIEMEKAEYDMIRRMRGDEWELSGVLTITAPHMLVSNFLVPVFEQFSKAHPLIDLRILATCDLLDLSRLEADLAIRISRKPGDTLKGLRLLEPHAASYASQDVADSITADPTTMIDWIVHDAYPHVPKGISSNYPNHRVRFRFDDMMAMVGAAQASMGVVPLPVFLGNAANGLIQIPVLPPQSFADIWVVGHPDVWSSPKLTAFRDILTKYCKKHRHQFVA